MIIDTRDILTQYENSTIEYKSLKKAVGKSADLQGLAKTCVCLANAQGGYLSHRSHLTDGNAYLSQK